MNQGEERGGGVRAREGGGMRGRKEGGVQREGRWGGSEGGKGDGVGGREPWEIANTRVRRKHGGILPNVGCIEC